MFSLLHVYLYNLYNCHKLYCLMTIKFWIWIWIWYTDMLLSFRDTIWIAIEMKKKKIQSSQNSSKIIHTWIIQIFAIPKK
jgi:hypothetical protein